MSWYLTCVRLITDQVMAVACSMPEDMNRVALAAGLGVGESKGDLAFVFASLDCIRSCWTKDFKTEIRSPCMGTNHQTNRKACVLDLVPWNLMAWKVIGWNFIARSFLGSFVFILFFSFREFLLFQTIYEFCFLNAKFFRLKLSLLF